MANYEVVKINCSNEKDRKILEEKFQDEKYDLVSHGKEFIIRNRHGLTHEVLMNMTEKNQNRVVAEYKFEAERYNINHILSYDKGEYKFEGAEFNYSFIDLELLEKYKEISADAQDEIIRFYNKVDSITKVDGELLVDDNYDKEIIIIFIVQSYEIKVSKISTTIEILSVTRIEDNNELEEKKEYRSIDSIDIPF